MNRFNTKGFGVVEILVAVTIFTAAIVAMVGTFTFYFKTGIATTEGTKANFLAAEGLEAMRYIRDGGWTANIASLSSNTKYYLSWSSGWQLSTTPNTIDGQFTREITLLDVYRNNSDSDIVATSSANPKTLDPGTKRVNVVVSWRAKNATSTVYVAEYLTNLFNE